MQLLEPERGPRFDAAGAFERLRDGLLRDNKVLPPVLGALALIIFAWIVAGALIGGPPDQSGRQAANQADQPPGNIAQNPGEDAGTLDAENRDAESFSQFESKNPFGEPPGVGPADEEGDSGTDGTDDTGDGGTGGSGTDGSGTGDDQYSGDDNQYGGGGDDFIDQTFPNGQGSGTESGDTGGDSGEGAGSGGDDDLFDSGGSLNP